MPVDREKARNWREVRGWEFRIRIIEKRSLFMRDIFKGKSKTWFVVGGLLLLMSITLVGHVQAAVLTDEEVYWLTYMREEEKLARDVYLYLYKLYPSSRIFYNISLSEQKHMDAIKTLIDKYGIDDPAAGNEEGVFDDGFLGDLYKILTDAGSGSLVEALKVGVFIEMTDIDDLGAGIALTDRKDIEKVYSNLLQGSLNHWDAFCSNLAKRGVPCEPYELSPEP